MIGGNKDVQIKNGLKKSSLKVYYIKIGKIILSGLKDGYVMKTTHMTKIVYCQNYPKNF